MPNIRQIQYSNIDDDDDADDGDNNYNRQKPAKLQWHPFVH